ncbi:nitroreductase/quinone reductase family protein [Streptomonospora nanhaiensis]|uniref:nitroreductase/quinone reductase family protein n=1 Tax=Streptomonospora nanhaiensis TaxID=1323731 RepID=UPI001C994458|nr:nitroreductase/quinone reductase family protein [Streptomonospora nanhaiensis]MBX9388155.1 nitroreductase/quinone reductase family protein [Streptomonospora nanhaiensis]
MGLKRWFYRGGRPNGAARAIDRWTAALYARGVAPDHLVALEVAGRRTGRAVTVPLVMAAVDGGRYLVSMLGEDVNWVRNVRAAGGAAAILHGRRERVRLEEVPVGERAPVLRAYLRRARNARAHLPVRADAPLAEFARAARAVPVFRVLRAAEGEAEPGGTRTVAPAEGPGGAGRADLADLAGRADRADRADRAGRP